MIRAKVTIYQKVTLCKTVEVEAEDYDDIEELAKAEVGSCLVDDYYDYDDFDCFDISVVEEWDEDEE